VVRLNDFIFTIEGIDLTGEELKAHMDRQLDMMRKGIAWVNSDLAAFDAQLPSTVEQRIESRRKKLLADRGLEGALGVRMRRRGDAPKTVPVQRKRLGVTPTRPKAAGAKKIYEDEYRLEHAQYEEIIDVILGMNRAFERNPSTFVKLNEEQLRDHFLLQLNGTFEGTAGGEMFNGSGKTDILVRIGDRNVFIGECKIWDGGELFTDGLDQLRSYLVWRDSKAAIVLFIGRKDVSAIIEKADEVILKHANCKGRGPQTPDPSVRRNYVFFHEGDHDREIAVAFLPVALPRNGTGN
jgi:hypothetical protein